MPARRLPRATRAPPRGLGFPLAPFPLCRSIGYGSLVSTLCQRHLLVSRGPLRILLEPSLHTVRRYGSNSGRQPRARPRGDQTLTVRRTGRGAATGGREADGAAHGSGASTGHEGRADPGGDVMMRGDARPRTRTWKAFRPADFKSAAFTISPAERVVTGPTQERALTD